MRRIVVILILFLIVPAALWAQNVTIHSVNRNAAGLFADIMRQTGKNFIYTPDVLKGLRLSVNADNKPLEQVLREMFAGTGVRYKMRGNNVLLSRVKETQNVAVVRKYVLSGFVREEGSGEPIAGATVMTSDGKQGAFTNEQGFYSLTLPGTAKLQITASLPGFSTYRSPEIELNSNRRLDITLVGAKELQEVEVVATRNDRYRHDAANVGSYNVSVAEINATPVIFGERDVIKTLQLQPGVSAGIEGMAGMYVHGGNADENLYMLDNVPMYQVNHFGGLFSAFNTDAIRNVDFHKSSFPAKYDGRLSSYMDVHLKDGSRDKFSGAVRLGLTSGAANVEGPIGRNTTYSVAVRRSWFDVLTAPTLAIVNAGSKDKTSFGYAFTDFNAKMVHRFSEKTSAHVLFYYGNDYLKGGTTYGSTEWQSEDKARLNWGNILASAGVGQVLSPVMYADFTAAYTRYFSSMSHESTDNDPNYGGYSETRNSNSNKIDDWIFRGDFDWRPGESHHIEFGVNAVLHSFLPGTTSRYVKNETGEYTVSDNVTRYRATETNAYIGDDWCLGEHWRVNYGVHTHLFHIERKTHYGLAPRLSARYKFDGPLTLKAGYSRTYQNVHQITESFISLPTDRWVPVTADLPPQYADKVFAGAYWKFSNGFSASVEGYWKWMQNLIEYRDNYYLIPEQMGWEARLSRGRGTAKGLDFMVAREFGKITGHVSYSLLWADRKFDDINGGRKFPARFDNRHKINILASWKINRKWEVNASWTGMSGNRITLPGQVWIGPDMNRSLYGEQAVVTVDVNNYRLPFYHRLDLGATRNTRCGYWTFSVYNAYCNMNVIAITRRYSQDGTYPYYKLRLIPIIPSVSYTWKF